MLRLLRNEKGIALLTVYVASLFITTVAGAAFSKSYFEMRHVEREVSRLRAFAAAEAGLQSALSQLAGGGTTAYTGFIDETDLASTTFQDVNGEDIGTISYDINYPDQADWVTVNATAVVDGDTRNLEGRVFLDSDLSKHLVRADTPSFGSGSNAQYGSPDYADTNGDGVNDYPQSVPANEDDRASMYFTGKWNISGSNVHLYGDAHAETYIDGNSSSQVHGDTYASNFSENGNGVSNSGVTDNLVVGDGYDDDTDRNSDTVVDADDYPDHHDLTSTGDGDAHKIETLTQIDSSFYQNHNSIPSFAGSSSVSRYVKFVANGSSTTVQEYTNSSYSTLSATHTLSNNSIMYVKGDIYVADGSEIGGRIAVVSSDDIVFDGSVKYGGESISADPTHSVAFMAKDDLFFRANSISGLVGILYTENNGSTSTSFRAEYDTNWNYNPNAKTYLRTYGNRVMKGSSNMGYYDDRVYGYDKNLKYYRPPGIPVYPDLRTVREE